MSSDESEDMDLMSEEDFDVESADEDQEKMGSDNGSEHQDEDVNYDSDRELQMAFKKGLLKTGLNYAVDAEPKRDINDVAALKLKLSELKQNLKFPERLDLIPSKVKLVATAKKLEKKEANEQKDNNIAVQDVDDDFKREMTLLVFFFN